MLILTLITLLASGQIFSVPLVYGVANLYETSAEQISDSHNCSQECEEGDCCCSSCDNCSQDCGEENCCCSSDGNCCHLENEDCRNTERHQEGRHGNCGNNSPGCGGKGNCGSR